MTAGDLQVRSAIAAMPVFQADGKFSMVAYERALSSRGMGPAGFEQRMQDALTAEQLQVAIQDSNWSTPAEIAESQRLRGQKRTFEYVTIDAERFLDETNISEEQARAHYDENQASFIAPEQVQLSYIELSRDSIAATLEADESELKGYYEQNLKNYMAPEQRQASHILFTLGKDAEEAEVAKVEEKVQSALDRLKAGEDFADLAKELSDDPGSAANGGDLGFFGRGVMVGPFEETAFALAEGEISEPVRSDFGIHLIRLEAIRPASGKAFEEVRDEVSEAYLGAEAERQLFEYAERLADLAYEDPDSLSPAAEGLGVEIKTSGWVPRTGAEGLFANDKLLNAAFSDDVLHQGLNSELIEISPQQMVVLRVDGHKESAVKPFEEVRDELIDNLHKEAAAEKAKEKGDALLAELKAGNRTLVELAAEMELEPVREELAQRNSPAPREVSNAVFRLPRPQGEATRGYGSTVLGNGDYVLIALEAVEDGEVAEDAPQRKALGSGLARSMGSAEFQHLIKNLRQSADVRIELTSGDEE